MFCDIAAILRLPDKLNMKKILLIDDHDVVRKGLILLLQDFYPGATILEAGNGEESTELLKKHEVDLVILDIQIPGTNSFELLNFIVNFYPLVKILVFSMGSENLYGKRFLMAGAHGYLSKEASMAEIRKAIETIMNGKKYLTEKLIDVVLQDFSGKHNINPFEKLSAREFEILTFLLRGYTIAEISIQVHLQPSTVGTYKSRIFEKLQVSNIIELKELASLYNTV